jgi:iron(III) transport system permease protein
MTPNRVADRLRRVALIAGALVLVAASLAPVLVVIFVSFRSGPPTAAADFVGANWVRLWDARDHLQATFALAAATAAIAVPLGVTFAWLLTRTNLPGRRLLEALMPLPLLVSSLITVVAYITLLAPRSGMLNAVLDAAFHVRFDIFSFQGIVLVMTLHLLPFVYFLTSAALDAVDSRYEEALRSAGGGTLATVRYITLPMIRPALLSAALLVFIFGAETFTVPTLLGPTAGIHTIQSDIYRAMTNFPTSPGFGAAAATTLMALAGLGLLLRRRFIGNSRRYVALSGRTGRRRRIDLGPGRWVAFAVIVAYLMLAVGLPYLVLVLGSFMRFVTPNLSWSLFTLDNYQAIFSGNLGRSLTNSLVAGIASATIAAFVALVVAHLVTRSRSPAAFAVQTIATLPLSIPALSLGLGILWIYVLLPLPLYGTIWILVIAYCTRYIGTALLILSSRLTQIDPELHEAVRVSGGSERHAFRFVTLPLAGSAIRSAWSMTFLLAIMEISMTILLYSSASATASVQIWLQEFGSEPARAHALAVILGSAGFIVLMIERRLARSSEVLYGSVAT